VSLSNHLRFVPVDWPWNTEMPIRNMRGRGDKAKAEVAFSPFSAKVLACSPRTNPQGVHLDERFERYKELPWHR
jgi:hypothetical protein